VYAVEPCLQNFSALKNNVHINRKENVIPLRYAVSDTSGTEMFVERNSNRHHHLKKVALSSVSRYTEVPSITLHDLMERHQIENIDFLKMDCEGSEGIILRSMPKDYLCRIRKIAMEFHDDISKLRHSQMQTLLEEADFTTHLTWDGKSTFGYLYAWRG